MTTTVWHYMFHIQRYAHSALCQAYLAVIPKADKIVWDFRDVVATVVTNGACANFRLGIKHLLTKLLQLSVVTVKEQMPSQLFGTLHRIETTVSPETVTLPLAQNVESALIVCVKAVNI